MTKQLLDIGTYVEFGAYCSGSGENDNPLIGVRGVVVGHLRGNKGYGEMLIGIGLPDYLALVAPHEGDDLPTSWSEAMGGYLQCEKGTSAVCRKFGVIPIEGNMEEIV